MASKWIPVHISKVGGLVGRLVHIHPYQHSFAISRYDLANTVAKITEKQQGKHLVLIGVEIMSEDHPCFGMIAYIQADALELLHPVDNEEALQILHQI